MKITNKEIGIGKPIYIIAEAGVNHNGDINLAKKLVDAAVYAGVDAVKFQTFKAELIVTKDAKQADYQSQNIGKVESQFDMLKRLELTEKDFYELKKYCEKKGIEFLSTPHSEIWSVDLLENLDISCYKIGSGDLTNIPILKYIAKLEKPVILSSGMANMEEIKEGIDSIKEEGNKQIVMLHCTTSYPCPENKVNLRAMQTIKENVDCLVGYSDHTTGLETAIISTCLGAVMFEKHFTLDNNMEGPDHKASLEPDKLKQIVDAIRFVEENNITDPYEAFDRLNKLTSNHYKFNKDLIEVILGKSEKNPDPEEIEIAKVARKSIVVLKDINEGEFFTELNIGIRRPGEGLPPKYITSLIGKKANKNLKKEEYVRLEDSI